MTYLDLNRNPFGEPVARLTLTREPPPQPTQAAGGVLPVQSNVPLPSRVGANGMTTAAVMKEAMSRMAVGDSAAFPVPKDATVTKVRSWWTAAARSLRLKGVAIRISTRSRTENGVKVVRCWRVA